MGGGNGANGTLAGAAAAGLGDPLSRPGFSPFLGPSYAIPLPAAAKDGSGGGKPRRSGTGGGAAGAAAAAGLGGGASQLGLHTQALDLGASFGVGASGLTLGGLGGAFGTQDFTVGASQVDGGGGAGGFFDVGHGQGT